MPDASIDSPANGYVPLIAVNVAITVMAWPRLPRTGRWLVAASAGGAAITGAAGAIATFLELLDPERPGGSVFPLRLPASQDVPTLACDHSAAIASRLAPFRAALTLSAIS